MIELEMASTRELIEIERCIHEMFADTRHPLNDARHPMHVECRKALDDLMLQADQLRSHWLDC